MDGDGDGDGARPSLCGSASMAGPSTAPAAIALPGWTGSFHSRSLRRALSFNSAGGCCGCSVRSARKEEEVASRGAGCRSRVVAADLCLTKLRCWSAAVAGPVTLPCENWRRKGFGVRGGGGEGEGSAEAGGGLGAPWKMAVPRTTGRTELVCRCCSGRWRLCDGCVEAELARQVVPSDRVGGLEGCSSLAAPAEE